MSGTPLNLTTSPKLDLSLNAGWESWHAAARGLGAAGVTKWLMQRTSGEIPRDDLDEGVAAMLGAGDEFELATARAELAELIEEVDDELAELLWEAVLAHGVEQDDPELIFESSSHLAGIAEDMGDPLVAAEYYIAFLNWRRADEHVSDPESVQTSFDEITRLAEQDGAPEAAAMFAYRQVGYTRIVDSDDEHATAGDWEYEHDPYTSWS